MYIKNMSILPTDLAPVIDSAGMVADKGVTIMVSREMSERFRTIFTEQLARVGFDRHYELTREGRLLESLIDRFFVE